MAGTLVLGDVAMVVGGGIEDELEDRLDDVALAFEEAGVWATGARTVPVTKTASPVKVFGAVVKTIDTSVTMAGSGERASMAPVRSSSSWRLKSLRKASLAWENMVGSVECLTAHRPEVWRWPPLGIDALEG
jgi:hypothetical protein